MPFVQRVVQPVNLAQVAPNSRLATGKTSKFHCTPGKCKNNNCINNQDQQAQLQLNGADANDQVDAAARITNIKDSLTPTMTTTITKAIIHADNAVHCQSNGFTEAFMYGTDTEKHDARTRIAVDPLPAPAPPMKKLKQHIEFISTAPSPSRSTSIPDTLQHARSISSQRRPTSAPQSPSVVKIVTGYEFDSISNITLSNALRQLASLVLIASDIFDDLHRELQSVGERACCVQRKIIAVKQRVSAYDPKTVTVPESDLLTFAQRKIHYDSDKSFHKELFTAETRPRSVRTLYEDAGKEIPSTGAASAGTSALVSPHTPLSFGSDVDGIVNDVGNILLVDDASSTGGAIMAAGSDELVCTPVFGKANRKMRTRIDAEIEIRLPAGIEDLRKWTSTEALGDVTVTPDCMHHVDTSISTSMIIGDNGLLTPALSPSVLSADAIDAMYSINVSNIVPDNTQIPNDINKDVPLNHRLPSPEEQCKIIALKYPAEVISVDTSGKRFERMCLARKSTTGCFTAANNMNDTNNLNDDVQTVSRRSRSRKVRGKRRNTIAGIDQKEIQDAANGDATTSATISSNSNNNNNNDDVRRGNEKAKKFGRSKSSDILKKESVALPYDKGKSTLTRLNSLKQWGRNRFKFMQRQDTVTYEAATGNHDVLLLGTSGNGSGSGGANGCDNNQYSIVFDQKRNIDPSMGGKSATSTKMVNQNDNGILSTGNGGIDSGIRGDIDDECVVHALVSQKNEGRFSHERKPSYSSSEKSVSVSSTGHLKGKLHLATCGNVKLRDTSSLNRQRRNGITAIGYGGGKDEQPHSSSGNWSASSESGRASIGSEITIQPKSSASNTSLNVSSFHPGSGPPSSMMSRRRFLNTSASSSVTSEGTATPELQVCNDGAYPNHLDDETSSAYSCDTEGYYTSFHMDSGLRTLKEEEPVSTMNAQNLHTSNYSFGSQSNQTVLTAENEYELFGRGSTSTTTSSAGTVCTTLMAHSEQNSLNGGIGPDVPERISSLSKLNKSSHSNSTSTSTLERSYSSSTIGSTLERTGTIKRNVNSNTTPNLKLSTAPDEDLEIDVNDGKKIIEVKTSESQEEEFDFEKRIRKRTAQPLPANACAGQPMPSNATATIAEIECSECSDLEGVERIERIKQKTTINAKRIPSMCIITPTTSDDENHYRESSIYDPNKTLTNNTDESSPSSKAAARVEAALITQDGNTEIAAYCSVDLSHCSGNDKVPEAPCSPNPNDKQHLDNKDHNLNVLKKNTQYGLNNMLDKFKVVLPNMKRSPGKSLAQSGAVVDDDELYDTAGEYVTIADISNNNRHNQLPTTKAVVGASSLGIYYSNDIIRRGQQQQGNELGLPHRETEYVSLNEMPCHLRKIGNSDVGRGAAGVNRCDFLNAAISSAVFGESNITPTATTKTTRIPTSLNSVKSVNSQCAESGKQSVANPSMGAVVVPMYAEINELREESESANNSVSLNSPSTLQHKGSRVRLNAQGKIIYDSDSLKRRKGAHTTFAPGPYVKETESALPEISSDVESELVESASSATDKAIGTSRGDSNGVSGSKKCSTSASESVRRSKTINLVPKTATNNVARLLLLNGGVAATRKIANVRPIVAQSSLKQNQNQKQQQQQLKNKLINKMEMPTSVLLDPYIYNQDNKNLLANNTNPFFQPTLMMSPQSLPGSTNSNANSSVSSASTTSFSSMSSSSIGSMTTATQHNEDYQRSHRVTGGHQKPPEQEASQFQRNIPVYWTLQNRRQTRPLMQSVLSSRDDLYATPIRRSERVAANNAAKGTGSAEEGSALLISPIVPRNRSNSGSNSTLFLTSTPTKGNSNNWDENSPERLNTCADRIGQSKTSLMDFKKLLLAKSAKTSPVQKKISAVELLKKRDAVEMGMNNSVLSSAASITAKSKGQQQQSLNSSMKLLDLSGSPKTFANRRMLRQGQFGSPSKSFVPKLKASVRSNSVQHTDVMSIIIPEANSEEDHSNTSSSGGSNNSSKTSSLVGEVCEDSGQLSAFDLKRNFFLQTEENNFMRGELKHNFSRSTSNASESLPISNRQPGPSNRLIGIPITKVQLIRDIMPVGAQQFQGEAVKRALDVSTSTGAATGTASAMPALETAL